MTSATLKKPVGRRRATADAEPDSPQRLQPLNPRLPSVNLLPPTYAAAAGKRARRRLAVVVTAASVGVVALAWVAQSAQIAAANSNLSSAQDKYTSLQAQTASPDLANAKQFYAAVDAMVATANTAMSGEVLYSKLITDLTALVPAGALLDGYDISVGGATSTAATPTGSTGASTSCPGTTPFETVPIVGCISFSGNAASREVVGQLLNNMTASTGKTEFVAPFIPTASAGSDNGRVSFTGTVGVTSAVFSGRYTDGYLTGGK